MPSITLSAAAKLNLTLGIEGRRADGYHEMKMVMQSVDLCDTVAVELTGAPGISIRCDDPAVPCDGRNLCHKAAQRFFEVADIRGAGAVISIRKVIPMQAGLAGGSADGAAVLAALNELTGSPLEKAQLLLLAASIGADLPFCLTGGTRLAGGIGEKLAALPPLPDCAVVIAKPEEGMPTATCFARYDAIAAPAQPDHGGMCAALAAGDLRGVAKRLCNVLEPAADLDCVELLKRRLRELGALGACMTGSGTAVFGLFERPDEARACADALAGECRVAFVARPCPTGWRVTAHGG
ncbi:4-(cytidine 5'-diphospho)-2-C-methyl-D-erythritol kinase [Clostridiaceae bacterium NSJ-31]|uniref:4-diphosphocytidyl-2-C-methyl-D-erythritol kinase n=1 Tax=Ligaoa zhengdingensis TaxID=2763658 RepID=A0A926DY68_9FIRM|nr:4-(cytidine 5'-diphospho)-2-C-methyl-D-erythritol kinase [Ligaoa zhengdingensis]MBC8546281.1 4-(cytidine 5'-diphospho)-2-C-methyl-D-erythritol kinase [Ligaoa zhengdingensis]